MVSRLRFLLPAVVWSLVATTHALAVPAGYQFIQFDVPGGTPTELIGINNVGQVVGSFGPGLPNSGNGFLYSGGVITSIHFPGSSETHPYGINDAGDIAGEYLLNGRYFGFVLRGGVYTSIDVPGSSRVNGRAINNAGQVVGYYNGGAQGGGFLWMDGQVALLPDHPDRATAPHDINDAGVIVGHSLGPVGFRLIGDTFETLPLTYVFNTNNAGDIVGATGGGSGAYLYSDGVFTTLTGLDGSPLGAAHGINDLGQIVGYYDAADGRHGFILTPDGTAFPPVRPVPEPTTLCFIVSALFLVGVGTANTRCRQ